MVAGGPFFPLTFKFYGSSIRSTECQFKALEMLLHTKLNSRQIKWYIKAPLYNSNVQIHNEDIRCHEYLNIIASKPKY